MLFCHDICTINIIAMSLLYHDFIITNFFYHSHIKATLKLIPPQFHYYITATSLFHHCYITSISHHSPLRGQSMVPALFNVNFLHQYGKSSKQILFSSNPIKKKYVDFRKWL